MYAYDALYRLISEKTVSADGAVSEIPSAGHQGWLLWGLCNAVSFWFQLFVATVKLHNDQPQNLSGIYQEVFAVAQESRGSR